MIISINKWLQKTELDRLVEIAALTSNKELKEKNFNI
jgi:hypothetical protein